jgi:hypothetical protein
MPAGRGIMQIERYVNLQISIAEASQGYFCNSSEFPLIAVLSYSKGPPTGSVSFYVWTDNTHSTFIGTTFFSGEFADYGMPASTLTANTTYYLQAVYSGDGTYLPASTPAGTSGSFIEGITNDVTSISAPVLYSYTPAGSGICENQPIVLHATVSPTHLPSPSVGTVTFSATYSSNTVTLGTATPSSGLASLTVSDPYTAFDSIDNVNWNVKASYADGTDTCYAGCGPSSGLNVFPTTNPITLTVGGATSICDANDYTYTVNVNSSTYGDAQGFLQLTLYYNAEDSEVQSSQLLYNSGLVTYSVGGSGTTVNIPLPGWVSDEFGTGTFSEAVGGTDIYLVAVWEANTGSCYGFDTSPNYDISGGVQDYSTQSPGLTLGVSSTDGSGYGDSVTISTYGDPIYFRATFTKNGPGSLTGASITITASGGYTSGMFPVTDPNPNSDSESFNIDFSIGEADIGGEDGGVFTAQATSATINCWNDGNSGTVTLNLPVEPPH